MRVLVTGASSLIGQHVAGLLTGRGDQVVTLQRTPRAAAAGVSSQVIEVTGSVEDPEVVRQAVQRCDAVVHLAARVGIVGTWEQFYRTNVVGTEVVLDAAVDAGVSRFVYVSSPSVAHAGEALVGSVAEPADPESTRGHYSTSKAMAEQLALAVQTDRMKVVAIRPHLVWGPGDTQLVGRIVERAKQGRLALVGSGAALIDSTYITNAADALVAALDRTEHVHRTSLVVSNGEPRPIADLVNGILRAHGLDEVHRRVPRGMASGVGWLAERAWERLPLSGEPPMTTFLAEQLGTAHWFDQTETRQLLQWSPKVSIDEGLQLLQKSAG